MKTTWRREPARGAFDYLLAGVPPSPRGDGGGSLGRVRVEIEIVDRRASPPPRYRFGTFTLWLLLGLVLLALVG